MDKEMLKVCEDFFSNKVIYKNGVLITELENLPINTPLRKRSSAKQNCMLSYVIRKTRCLACHRILDVMATKIFQTAEANFCPYCGCYIPEIIIEGE